MTLEQQVCSLPLAQRLKELGVKQEALFWWEYPGEYKGAERYLAYAPSVVVKGRETEENSIAAFTVAELGEMLPVYIEGDGYSNYLRVVRSSVWQFHYGDFIHFTAGNDDTEADARAKMLIYLLENKLI